nr:hypothetical protein [uncultured Chitinophaga sp.]
MIVYKTKLLELANKVSFTAVQQYLLMRGWHKRNTNIEDVVVITSPNDNPNFDILLPLTRSYADYNALIYEALNKASKYEQRDIIHIINDLIVPPADTVRFQVDNEDTTNGIIPLKSGFELLESARKSLLAAACDLVSPEPFHPRMGHKEAAQFIDSCYLGQSERGSYITSIVCPFIKVTEVEAPVQLSLFSSEQDLNSSFTRDVTSSLMKKIQRVKRCIETGDDSPIVRPQSSQEIVSANLLESIVEMNEFTNNSRIIISTTWAPMIKMPKDIESKIEITNDYIAPLKSIIDKIRPEIMENAGEYVGKINQIKAHPEIKDRTSGEVTFVFIGDADKAVVAKFILAGGELTEAMRAFENGRNIMVSGNLKASGRQRTIDVAGFRVID